MLQSRIHVQVETDMTGPEDLGDDLDDGVDDVDVDDQICLFDRNVHPPEYYRNGAVTFNETAEVEGGDYSAGTEMLLDAVQEHWERYGWRMQSCLVSADGICRFCTTVLERQGFESISLAVLHSVFDWFLNQKVGKKGRKKHGIKKRSSLGPCRRCSDSCSRGRWENSSIPRSTVPYTRYEGSLEKGTMLAPCRSCDRWPRNTA
jgi:hypothetical protein